METRAERASKRAEEGKGEEVWQREELEATGARKKVCLGLLGQGGAGVLKVVVPAVQDTDTAEIEDILPLAETAELSNLNQDLVWLEGLEATCAKKKICHALPGQGGAEILKVAVPVDNKAVREGIEDILPIMMEETPVPPVLVDLVTSDEEEGETTDRAGVVGDVASDEEFELKEMSHNKDGDNMVEVFNSLTLAPETEDNDHERSKKKHPRQKEKQAKRKGKWNHLSNHLYFVPGSVLEKPSGTSTSGRALRREGFIIYDRLTCKECGKTFHKSYGLSTHPCPGLRG